MDTLQINALKLYCFNRHVCLADIADLTDHFGDLSGHGVLVTSPEGKVVEYSAIKNPENCEPFGFLSSTEPFENWPNLFGLELI